MFHGMIENTAAENNSGDHSDEVNIDELNPAVLEKILEFIYTNRVGKFGHFGSI
jgi:hypothetical protein